MKIASGKFHGRCRRRRADRAESEARELRDAPAPRSSGRSRAASRTSPMRVGERSCPLRAPRGHQRRHRAASIRSATRSRHAARSSPAIADQPGPRARAARARRDVGVVASTTVPTTSRRSAGLRTGCAMRFVARAPGHRRIGARMRCRRVLQGFGQRCARRLRRKSRGRASCGARGYSATAAGSRMRRAETPPARAVVTGSATSSSMATSGSTMRFTNDELAPFSSRRRTRYASSVSCEPTGA